MVQILWFIRDKILSFVRDERGQDAFEYLLVIGGVSVGIVTAIVLAPGFITDVVTAVKDAVMGVLS
jgi:Flp pilus assembly pilin Flp